MAMRRLVVQLIGGAAIGLVPVLGGHPATLTGPSLPRGVPGESPGAPPGSLALFVSTAATAGACPNRVADLHEERQTE